MARFIIYGDNIMKGIMKLGSLFQDKSKAKAKAKSQKKVKKNRMKILSSLAGITAIAILVGLLSGCSGNISKRDVGVGVGAVAGGLIGSTMGGGGGKIATTIIGAGAGALAGGYIGGQMDENDRMKS